MGERRDYALGFYRYKNPQHRQFGWQRSAKSKSWLTVSSTWIDDHWTPWSADFVARHLCVRIDSICREFKVEWR